MVAPFGPLIFIVNQPRLTQNYVDRFTRWLSIALSQLHIIPLLINSSAVSRQSVDFQRWLAMYASALIIIRRPENDDPAFERIATEYAGLSLGSIFHLEPRSSRNSAVKFIDSLTSNIIPISNSDSRLPAELRGTIQSLAYGGLPPVAECYLRFRLAQSDVERYLCLLDSVETLIKMSAIVLIACRW